jgi:hypothetical protein
VREEWNSYLDKVQATDVVRTSLIPIYRVAVTMSPVELTDIFLTDYVTDEGQRIFENAWFFGETYCLEAKSFLTESNCDLVNLKGVVGWFRYDWSDFDFEAPEGKSRLKLTWNSTARFSGQLRATRENCLPLLKIGETYIKANIFQGYTSGQLSQGAGLDDAAALAEGKEKTL